MSWVSYAPATTRASITMTKNGSRIAIVSVAGLMCAGTAAAAAAVAAAAAAQGCCCRGSSCGRSAAVAFAVVGGVVRDCGQRRGRNGALIDSFLSPLEFLFFGMIQMRRFRTVLAHSNPYGLNDEQPASALASVNIGEREKGWGGQG